MLLTVLNGEIRAQDTSGTGWQRNVSIQAVQADFAIFAVSSTPTYSGSVAVDVDAVALKHPGGSSSLFGFQLGTSYLDWPMPIDGIGYHYNRGYRCTDYDLLLRHTYHISMLRTDVLAGLTVRYGHYYIGRNIDGEYKKKELRRSQGLKLGGGVTLMLIRPVLALRLKASCFFGGYHPIEGGALGLGLVLGWQRED